MAKPELLLDVCCGPCAISAIESLKEKRPEFEIVVYVNNSNLASQEEYNKRLDAIKKVLEYYEIKRMLIVGYKPDEWAEYVKGHENDKEGGKRCELCYRFRLQKAADHAWRNNFLYFTTTLTAGPMKNSDLINKVGTDIAAKHELVFLEEDFKKENGFQKSIEISKKLGIYRQDNCGCEFSLKD